MGMQRQINKKVPKNICYSKNKDTNIPNRESGTSNYRAFLTNKHSKICLNEAYLSQDKCLGNINTYI